MMVNQFFTKDQNLSRTDQFKASVLVSILLFLAFACLSVVVFMKIHPLPPDNPPPAFALFLVIVAWLILLKTTKSHQIIGNFAIFSFILTVALKNIGDGYIFFSQIPSFILIILIAYLVLKPRFSMFWTFSILSWCAFCYFMINENQSEIYFRYMMEEQNLRMYFYSNFIVVVSILVLIHIGYYHSWVIENKYEENNKILTDINDRLESERKVILSESERFKSQKGLLSKINSVLKEKKSKLEESQENLKASNLELEQYAHAASHDLKQPIRTISSFAQLLEKHLKKKGEKDVVSEEYLDFIISGSKNMEKLVNDLLDYGKMSSTQDQQFKMISLYSLFEVIKNEYRKEMEYEEVEITASDLPQLNLISVKVKQLLRNLIGNAIKFRKANQPLVINLSAMEKESCWEISVSDNGIGIEKQYIEKVFEPFRKLHLKEQYEGSGLGLATCEKIVQLHDGKIWAESKEGMGTTIIFTLKKGLKNDVAPKETEKEIVQTV